MLTLDERFWKSVEKSTDCWIWTGCCNQDGYGKIKVNGTQISAHRLSWQIHYPEQPIGDLWVLHKCDNPSCVRPDHLFLGTPHDNCLDAMVKDRHSKIRDEFTNLPLSDLEKQRLRKKRDNKCLKCQNPRLPHSDYCQTHALKRDLRPRRFVTLNSYKRSDNGKMAWVVKWSPQRGDPRRRTFTNEADAVREADHIERLFRNGMRVVGNLSIQELAGVALMLAQIPNVPPHEVIQYYLQAHGLNGHSANSVPLESAAAQYIALRDNPDEFSHRQFTSVRQHLNRLARHFPGRMLNTIRVEELNDYVQEEIGGAPKTRANHVIDIRAFGRWCRSEKKWLPRLVPTAFEETRMPRVKASNKEIYTPEEMTHLLVFTPTHTLGFMTTGAFGGMRAAERLRLTGEHWQSDNEQIAADRDITKTARRRIIGSLPNLAAWMRIIETEKDEYIVRRRKPYEQVAKICKAAGVKWKFNALRTSFASYHLQKFRNGALTAALDGHSEDQLETDYKSLTGVNDRTAEEWFAITPESVIAYAAKHGLPEPEWANKI